MPYFTAEITSIIADLSSINPDKVDKIALDSRQPLEEGQVLWRGLDARVPHQYCPDEQTLTYSTIEFTTTVTNSPDFCMIDVRLKSIGAPSTEHNVRSHTESVIEVRPKRDKQNPDDPDARVQVSDCEVLEVRFVEFGEFTSQNQ